MANRSRSRSSLLTKVEGQLVSPSNNQLALTSGNLTLVKVAIPVPLRRVFDYLLPEGYPVIPLAGMRVEVPFGSSSKIGVIHGVECINDSDLDIDFSKLKSLNRILDETPLLPNSLISLYCWMIKYYHAPQGEIWQTMLPTALMKGKETNLVRTSRWYITELGLEALNNGLIAKSAIKQRLTLKQLEHHSEGIAHDRLKDFDFTYSHLKTLAGKKWVSRDYESSQERFIDVSNLTILPNDIELNEEQRVAIDTVSNSLNRYASFLLFGVTASGKTEVYLRLIQQVIEQGQQALVLVPEIGLTPQTLRRFKDRFNVEIVLLHSAMSETQRLQSWLKAKDGSAKIIIGTRSALFTPLKNPGIIIIDEEHDLSFRQQQGFRYSARDVALVRASLEKIPVLLGSASPSLESLNNVQKNKMTLLRLKQKAQNTSQLKYRIIDLKNQAMNQGLSYDLIQSIKHHLKQKGQILLFLNRRGYAPVLLCHECGWSNSCSRCDINYTYHHQSGYLQCHHCGSNRRAPVKCPQCQCKEMIPVGLGTERLQEIIQHLFPEAKTARIDRDTTRKKSAMSDFVSSVKAGEIDILIGTQMLAKGHHFPDVTLVALIDMDGALYSADYRAPEYAAQLITQVSGRAGRAGRAGEVIIQTHLAEHPMLDQVINAGYSVFADSAIEERVEAELPPSAFSAMFMAESPQIEKVRQFLQDVKQELDRYENLKVELLGPAPAVYAKKAGKFRYQLFLQTNSRNQLHQLLDLTLTDIEKLKSANRVRWRLEVDPVGDS
jgi:primosomal protein N' (replication factor Y) (superfamily II helicase)